MLKKIALLFSLTASFIPGGYAQKICNSDIEYQKLVQAHPEIAVYQAQLENEIQQDIKHGSLSQFARTTNGPDTTVYDIPIVIHVIHDYGPEYLSDNTILDAISHWTQIDMGQNYSDTSIVIPTFRPYIGNPRIHLHLATIDPDGNPTRGIVRHQSYLTTNGGDESKLDDWPQDKYVNIWFINSFGADNAGAAAYAYYPGSAAGIPYYDGVICLYNYIDEDKTIPHELGHVFNLRHVWGNNNNAAVQCGGDDLVDDTPPTKGHLFDCSSMLYDTACSIGYMKTYQYVGTSIDSVTIDYPDTANTQNIMDYSGCMEMFTKGQVARMRAALASTVGGRSNLWSPANLAATGALAPYPDLPPVADFSVERGQGTTGLSSEKAFFMCADNITSFAFKNRSWNDTIDNVQWTFSNNATTPTSNSMTATVLTKFMQPGWATITLTATSNAGTNTIAKQAVYVADTNMIPPATYIQNFTTQSEFANWPMFNYYNNNFKWEWYNGAGYDDNNCIRYRSYDYRTSPENRSGTPVGDYDDIFTPGFDLSDTTGPVNLDFYTAGAAFSGSTGIMDTLEIWASNTCGTRWQRIATIAGSDLANNGIISQEYVPVSFSEWKAQTITVPAAYRTSKTFFRFRYRPGDSGNDLYLDKFSVSGVTTEVREVMNNHDLFKIYPNPAHTGCNLAFETGDDGNVIYEITDVTGKLVYRKMATYNAHATVQEHLSANTLPFAGIYFVTLSNAGRKITQKLVIY